MADTRHYLIFGATSELAAAFMDVADHSSVFTLVARDAEKLAAITSASGTLARKHVCDLQDEASIKELVKVLKSEKLKFDGVLCAAGAHEVLPLRLYSKEKFMIMMDVNFFTVSNVLASISSILNPAASIVATSSAATQRGAGAVAGYVAAKAAVEGLVRAAALEFAPKKVRVNSIAPGVFRSKMSEAFLGTFTDTQLERLDASHPLGIGTAHDVAGCIKFLMGPDSSWMTGQNLVVDGGYSINA